MQLKREKELTKLEYQELSSQHPLMNKKLTNTVKFRANLLQFLFNKHDNQGFTLIALLIIIIILGILAAIALPSFLNCANKGKQSESKTYVGSINRGQQAYFIEKRAFSNSINDLGLGIKTQTTNYNYSTRATTKAAFNYGVARKDGSQPIKSYVGAVFVVTSKVVASTSVKSGTTKDELTTEAILCEANSPGTTKPADPTYQNGKIACGFNTHELGSH